MTQLTIFLFSFTLSSDPSVLSALSEPLNPKPKTQNPKKKYVKKNL